MQVTEREQVTQTIVTGRKCTVCDHSDRARIDSLLADASISKRSVSIQFGLTPAAVLRHANSHLQAKIKAAVARREAKEGDIFMERHEHLYREALQYIEDAKGAVKMQKVTAEVETESGITLQDRYERFRDVGAMAPALGAATALQRVLGDATARFSQPAATTVHNHLSVIMPRQVEQQPAIAQGEVIDVPAIEPGEPATTKE